MASPKTLERDKVMDRIPPQNLDAEQSALGSMMVDRSAIAAAGEILDGADFYRPSHGLIFEAMTRLDQRDEPVDLITLQEELRSQSQLDEVGGTEYLMTLVSQVPSAARVAHYAQIVREKAVKREILAMAGKANAIAMEEDRGAEESIAAVWDMVSGIGGDIGSAGVLDIRDVVNEVSSLIEERAGVGGYVPVMKTGLSALDRMSLGIPVGMTLVCARPTEGKSSLLYQIIERSPGAGTWLLVSPDDSAQSFVFRMISRIGRVPLFRLMAGRIFDEEVDRIADAEAQVFEMPLRFYDEETDIRIIAAKIRYQQLKNNICGVMIDYGQLLSAAGDSKVEQLMNVSIGLKSMAIRLKLPIVVALQLNREAARRRGSKSNPYPTLDDIAWCDQFQRDANQAYVIHNPKPQTEDDTLAPVIREARIELAKQKNGPTLSTRVLWNAETLTFTDIEERYGDASRLPYNDD
jgi:replicative DNA helicase